MADRPYTVLSCAMSLDGYVNCAEARQLALSNPQDFDRVDAVRAASDAILVGATTVREDDPRLLVKSVLRREERQARGRTASPLRVTVTRTGRLAADARLFTADEPAPLVYCPTAVAPAVRRRLGERATVVPLGSEVDLGQVVEDLSDRGVERLLVEGGATVHTQLLTADLADQLDLVVAPFFVGDPLARRFVDPGAFPWSAQRRARLAEVAPIGDVALLRYALSDRFGA